MKKTLSLLTLVGLLAALLTACGGTKDYNDAEAKKLVTAIIGGQKAEIATMKGLLGS